MQRHVCHDPPRPSALLGGGYSGSVAPALKMRRQKARRTFWPGSKTHNLSANKALERYNMGANATNAALLGIGDEAPFGEGVTAYSDERSSALKNCSLQFTFVRRTDVSAAVWADWPN